MTFTKGSVFIKNSENNTTVSPPSNSYIGYGMRNIVSAMVQYIPGLTIDSVKTETTSVYDVVLDYQGLKIELRNSSSDVYCKVGNRTENYVPDMEAVRDDCVLSYAYSETGIFTVSVCPIYRENAFVMSVIPVLVQLSSGVSKSVLWFRYGTPYTKISAPVFAGSTTTITNLLDPETGDYYTFVLASIGMPSDGLTGRAVVLPAIISSDIGEITSYTIGGENSQLYTIYPGVSLAVRTLYPGLESYLVGSTNYIAVTDSYFMIL